MKSFIWYRTSSCNYRVNFHFFCLPLVWQVLVRSRVGPNKANQTHPKILQKKLMHTGPCIPCRACSTTSYEGIKGKKAGDGFSHLSSVVQTADSTEVGLPYPQKNRVTPGSGVMTQPGLWPSWDPGSSKPTGSTRCCLPIPQSSNCNRQATRCWAGESARKCRPRIALAHWVRGGWNRRRASWIALLSHLDPRLPVMAPYTQGGTVSPLVLLLPNAQLYQHICNGVPSFPFDSKLKEQVGVFLVIAYLILLHSTLTLSIWKFLILCIQFFNLSYNIF